MRSRLWFAACGFTLATAARGQTLATSVVSTDGNVQVVFPVRPNVCGDGESYIRTWRSRGTANTYVGSSTFTTRDGWNGRPCVNGPARVLALVLNGGITRLSVFVGPVPRNQPDTRTVNASAADVMTWLGDLAQRGTPRVASRAIQAMMFADAPAPWPLVLRIARDAERARETRQSALTWLAAGATDKLGLGDLDDNASDDDETRAQAVFVVSQWRKSESVPKLIDLARNAKHRAVKKAAIFWLGQSGDSRGAEVFADMLGLR